MRFIHAIVQWLLSAPKFPGRDFLIERLPRWFLSKPKGETTVNTRFGFSIIVDPLYDQNIENVIYERGVYEQGTVHLIQQLLKEGDVFVDVGANIGFLSMVASRKVGANGKVYAFEAVPDTANILQSNLDLNGIDNVCLERYAVGNEHAGKIYIYPEKGNRGGASGVNKRSDQPIEVNLLRLGDGPAFDRIDLIKIDVEGMELDVLKGAEDLIRKFKPSLIVEYSVERKNSGNEHELFHWLNDLGIYGFYKLSKGKERKSKLVPITSKTAGLPVHDNLICLPK